MRRDFFPEAALLFALDRSGRGEPVPEWANRALDAARPEPRETAAPVSRDERRPAPRLERLERAARAPFVGGEAFGDAPFGDVIVLPEPPATRARHGAEERADTPDASPHDAPQGTAPRRRRRRRG
jgi:hypothetical protein